MNNRDVVSIEKELRLVKPIQDPDHEVVMEILLTASMMAKEGDRILRRFHLSGPQMNILMLLRHQAGEEGVDQSRLGRWLVVNRANVTGLVDRMQRRGLVTRRPDPADRRVKRVLLAPAGIQALKAAEKSYSHGVHQVMGSMTRNERRALSLTLGKLRAAMKGKAESGTGE